MARQFQDWLASLPETLTVSLSHYSGSEADGILWYQNETETAGYGLTVNKELVNLVSVARG